MKLGHIVKYHYIFVKFNNGRYRTMPSGVMVLWLWKFNILNNVRSLSWIVLIRILWNLVTLLSTMISFLKFDNGLYCTMPSGVMALCLWKFIIWNNVRSLNQIVLIRILWNLVTLFSFIMSSSSSLMIHITLCNQLWPFVDENSPFEMTSLSKLNSFYLNFMKLGHIV